MIGEIAKVSKRLSEEGSEDRELTQDNVDQWKEAREIDDTELGLFIRNLTRVAVEGVLQQLEDMRSEDFDEESFANMLIAHYASAIGSSFHHGFEVAAARYAKDQP